MREAAVRLPSAIMSQRPLGIQVLPDAHLLMSGSSSMVTADARKPPREWPAACMRRACHIFGFSSRSSAGGLRPLWT